MAGWLEVTAGLPNENPPVFPAGWAEDVPVVPCVDEPPKLKEGAADAGVFELGEDDEVVGLFACPNDEAPDAGVALAGFPKPPKRFEGGAEAGVVLFV